MYKYFLKRIFDIIFSFLAIIFLSPLLLILIVCGALFMHGNPFFVQKRPGKDEKIFNLVKFRTMTNNKDNGGKLLSNQQRLNGYGKFLRKSSLDELPELFNIFIGDMSIVGPRPLLPEYLPYYKMNERKRHDVRPGLTGLAQVNGRNCINSWEERFNYDITYVEKCSFSLDVKIIFKTIGKVFKHSDILVGNNVVLGRLDDIRKNDNTNMEIRL